MRYRSGMRGPSRDCPICGEHARATQHHCPHDGAPLGRFRDDPHLGCVVLERYRLNRLVGYGSTGRVYRAERLDGGPPSAVKVMYAELAEDPKLARRFRRESLIAPQLRHPHIVEIFDSTELPPRTDGGTAVPAFTMEFLEGMSLRSALARHEGGLGLTLAVHICLQICQAVGTAHDAGVVHRDLKPANVILLSRDHAPDFVKVLDFGIAKTLVEPGSHPTTRGSVLGTPHYISPEGALGEMVTPAGDVYSIATLLFECLSGRPPFDDPSPIRVLVQHASSRPPRLDQLGGCQPVPRTIVDLIDQNLAKRPTERLPHASAFGEELETAARAHRLWPAPASG